jgi:hypothetical protein
MSDGRYNAVTANGMYLIVSEQLEKKYVAWARMRRS